MGHDELDWPAVWTATAVHLRQHTDAGLQALLTEDVARFATVLELTAAGVPASAIDTEWRRPGVKDSVDLVVTKPEFAAIEFKYPREPRETNAAWTQHLGEALKDFYRLATMPADATHRWCVQLWSTRVNRYFDGVAERHGVRLGQRPGLVTTLDPSRVKTLPATATGLLARWMPELPAVTATCVVAEPVSADLTLVAHQVAPATLATVTDAEQVL